MIASMLYLGRKDIKTLRITDAYSIHRVVYDLYEDVRSDTEKKSDVPSGILYADKGGNWNVRKILMLSNREPRTPHFGVLKTKVVGDEFLHHHDYAFEIIINPTKRDKKTGKLIAIHEQEKILEWFATKSVNSWGFEVDTRSLQIQNSDVKIFKKKDHVITQNSATMFGRLTVIDREKFIKSFQLGIGRGRAFGFGLLQIIPLKSS